MHKLNVIQLQLSYPYWRLELDSFPPQLQYFYTKSDIATLISYGNRYGVSIVPEVNLLDHVQGIIDVFPYFECSGLGVLCLGNPDVLPFIDSVFSEIFTLFDSPYVHIGGIRKFATKKRHCKKCQRLMADLDIQDEGELMSWLVDRIRKSAHEAGKTILIKEPPASLFLHSSIIVDPVIGLNLGLPQFQNDKYEGPRGLLTLRRVYAIDPTGSQFGIHAILNTDFINSEEHLNYQAFPRLCALSELGWTQGHLRTWKRFHAAVRDRHSARMANAGIGAAQVEPYPFAIWTHGDVSSTWANLTWNATAAFPVEGAYSVQFHWRYGDVVQIMSASLLTEDGDVVSTDEHLGIVGKDKFRTVYHLVVPEGMQGLRLQATIRGPNGVVSHGEVYVDFTLE
jgi:hypothetical protein